MNEETVSMLKKLAERKCWTEEDDFDPKDFSGGNFDDAYYGGVEDGQAQLARQLLKSVS